MIRDVFRRRRFQPHFYEGAITQCLRRPLSIGQTRRAKSVTAPVFSPAGFSLSDSFARHA